jgi:hypothetical protein
MIPNSNLSLSIFLSRPLSVSFAPLRAILFQKSCSLPATWIRCLSRYVIPGLCAAQCYHPLRYIQGDSLPFQTKGHHFMLQASASPVHKYPYDQY